MKASKYKFNYQFGGDSQYADTSFFDTLLNYAYKQQDEPEVEDNTQEESKEVEDNSDYQDLQSKYEELLQRVNDLTENNSVNTYNGNDEFLNFLFDDSNNNEPINISSKQTHNSSKNGFRVFNTPEEGRAALENQLELYKSGKSAHTTGNETLYEAMAKYAPAADHNNPKAYAEFIGKKLGISPNTPIKQVDTKKWADAITIMEGNKSGNNPGNLKHFQDGGAVVDSEPYKDYYTQYMNSPRYKAMLNNEEIDLKRRQQLSNFPIIQEVPNSFFDKVPNAGNLFVGGYYDKDKNTVSINNKTIPGRRPATISHEISHHLDGGGQYIPQSDIDKMNSLLKSDVPDTEPFKYLKQPTEIRARLNQIRFRGKKDNVFDPFTQEFKKEYLDKYKNSTELQDLRKLYNDDQIVELFNSISSNNKSDLQTAQNGIDISKNGYNYDSPYQNEPYLNIISPTGDITMEKTPYNLLGVDEFGNKKIMKPGKKYKFPGKYITEIKL